MNWLSTVIFFTFGLCGFWSLSWYGVKRGMLTGDIRIGVVIAAPYFSPAVYSLHSAFTSF